MNVKLPLSLKNSIKKGLVSSVIQFGSSLRGPNYKDIDLGIILKKGCYEEFSDTVYRTNFQNFDISLIEEEEIQNTKKFRFGKHGLHFLFSLINGKTLFGKNPFKKLKVSESEIKKSIFLSLFIYIEDTRRAIFLNVIDIKIKKRWPKFLRLCLYLLNDELKYPNVLRMTDNRVKSYLKQYNFNIDLASKNFKTSKNWLIAYDTIWNEVLKQVKINI